MNEQQINQLSKEIFEFNKSVGWWDDMDRPIFQTLQLVSTEIAEATEGARKNLMDDHLPHRKMEEVELADALIRILDFGGRYDLVFSLSSIKEMGKNYPPYKDSVLYIDNTGDVASVHFLLNIALSKFGSFFYDELYMSDDKRMFEDITTRLYSTLIALIIHTSNKYNYDLFGALLEKFEYNKTRADHKRENREKEHGKKF